MEINEAKTILKNAGYICEKKQEKVADVIIKALTQTNSGWIYLKEESIRTAPKPRLEFTKDDGSYLMLVAQDIAQQSWNAFIGTKDNESSWDEIKENISYYDILDLFVK